MMKMNVLACRLAYSLAMTLPMGSVAAQNNVTGLQSVFTSADVPRSFSGVAVIAKGNEITFSYTSASQSVSSDLAAPAFTLQTPFVTASLSKQMTAALVMREVGQGRVDLDAPISQYLNYLKGKWNAVITIRQLLNHLSGIVAVDKPLKTVPGEVFAYSNTGYNLLGELVATTSGKDYEMLASDMFEYCGMDNTSPSSNTNNALRYHEKSLGELVEITKDLPASTTPSAGIISTAEDLVAWNQCLHNSDLISAKSHVQMVAKGATRKHRWGELGYGFGLQLSDKAAIQEWSHSGYVLGYISTLSYYPKSDTSMILLENISWYPKDMTRVFHYHDKLRSQLLKQLINK
ncbi:serine hydrolase domain-containing protein [Moritella viscosa]|uniref:Alkaline D-peptidase and alkaline D-peptidase fusion n=1 Tax=Moritella viscosa TaxID=80854 RepID=A0A1L0C5Y9_9GAMM|nr:serine hydrolase domain-containing protein [Moritella viscosa]SGZ09669.1 Alkaline D-peptidase and alkaline D-peptidase fusion [Moritella viscosa]SHO11432.1 Alkaline D-peptidase and alkaline D-peptidase fusion [Moritella viscosa]SHO11433.1 Alkaline D-peptidase and alkaline D-peptidase fusion [Moritella viscosa]SHO16156.1 Alkaline D-peptidase and alkaline D-peptidase fusion [Moritella viscosa]SHO17956.1 Alkaline D-peptidase and alkaline D-peptidase fusion [Moritella viscosa]